MCDFTIFQLLEECQVLCLCGWRFIIMECHVGASVFKASFLPNHDRPSWRHWAVFDADQCYFFEFDRVVRPLSCRQIALATWERLGLTPTGLVAFMFGCFLKEISAIVSTICQIGRVTAKRPSVSVDDGRGDYAPEPASGTRPRSNQSCITTIVRLLYLAS